MRSERNNQLYTCKGLIPGGCLVDKANRNTCKACRYEKCLSNGMRREGYILYDDVPCVVCYDRSSGKHCGIFACIACASFFKRSVRNNRRYTCKAPVPGICLVDKANRNCCKACRFEKCLDNGMRREALQPGSSTQNETVRQKVLSMQASPPRPDVEDTPLPLNLSFPKPNLSLPKPNLISPPLPTSYPLPMDPQVPLHHPLSTPDLSPTLCTPKSICETAAHQLFMKVKWTTPIHISDYKLSLEDRLVLLEESCNKLFLLGAAQYFYPMNLNVA